MGWEIPHAAKSHCCKSPSTEAMGRTQPANFNSWSEGTFHRTMFSVRTMRPKIETSKKPKNKHSAPFSSESVSWVSRSLSIKFELIGYYPAFLWSFQNWMSGNFSSFYLRRRLSAYSLDMLPALWNSHWCTACGVQWHRRSTTQIAPDSSQC